MRTKYERRESRGAKPIALEIVPELILSQSGLLDYSLQEPPRKFASVHWHDRSAPRRWISQGDMTSFLPVKVEACAL